MFFINKGEGGGGSLRLGSQAWTDFCIFVVSCPLSSTYEGLKATFRHMVISLLFTLIFHVLCCSAVFCPHVIPGWMYGRSGKVCRPTQFCFSAARKIEIELKSCQYPCWRCLSVVSLFLNIRFFVQSECSPRRIGQKHFKSWRQYPVATIWQWKTSQYGNQTRGNSEGGNDGWQ